MAPTTAFALAASDSRQRSGISLPQQIPFELYDAILFYLDEERSAAGDVTVSRILQRRQGVENLEDGKDTLRGLRTGSLVCRYWSNLCRRSIFYGATLRVRSPDDANALLKYAMTGCSSLSPICMLIGRLKVRQCYEASTSFLHRLHYLTLLNSRLHLFELTLSGPIPNRFPRHNLGTPHWGVPPAIATPPSLLPFERIYAENIHLPSFKHAVKYVMNFARAKDRVTCDKMTWDQSTVIPVAIPRVLKKSCPPNQDEADVEILALRCTDNFLLCLYVALARPDCPLHWLPDVQQTIRMATSLWELYPARNASTERCDLYWGTCIN